MTRWLFIPLGLLLIAIQFPLWLGKGGWFKVWELEDQLKARQTQNATLQARNDALDAEVRDLKTGTEAFEEHARAELGMVKPGETFFRIVVTPKGATTPNAAPK